MRIGTRRLFAGTTRTAVFLAMTLSAASTPVTARASAPARDTSEAEKLFYDGSAAYSAADYLGAIEKFTAALAAATRDGAASQIRSAMLINLAESHERAFEMHEDRIHLKKADAIYSRLREEAEAAGYSEKTVDKARVRQEGVRAKLAELANKVDATPARPVADTEATSEPPPAAESTPAAAVTTDKNAEDGETAETAETSSSSRTTGIALLAVGAPLIAGGAVLVGNGARFRAHAQAQVDMHEDPPGPEQTFVDEEAKRGRVQWITGAGVATAGAVLVVAGAVSLARSKRASPDAARVSAGPALARGLGGLTIWGRF